MPEPEDQLAVAADAAAAPEVLESLAPASVTTSDEQELVLTLAGNPATPVHVLARLCALLEPVLSMDDEQPRACAAGLLLCSDPRVPFGAIEALLTSPTVGREFRRTVARETSREETLRLLTDDHSGKVRSWALKRLPDLARVVAMAFVLALAACAEHDDLPDAVQASPPPAARPTPDVLVADSETEPESSKSMTRSHRASVRRVGP